MLDNQLNSIVFGSGRSRQHTTLQTESFDDLQLSSKSIRKQDVYLSRQKTPELITKSIKFNLSQPICKSEDPSESMKVQLSISKQSHDQINPMTDFVCIAQEDKMQMNKLDLSNDKDKPSQVLTLMSNETKGISIILADSKYKINLGEPKQTKQNGYATILMSELHHHISDASKLTYLVYMRTDKLTGKNFVLGQSEQLSLSEQEESLADLVTTSFVEQIKTKVNRKLSASVIVKSPTPSGLIKPLPLQIDGNKPSKRIVSAKLAPKFPTPTNSSRKHKSVQLPPLVTIEDEVQTDGSGQKSSSTPDIKIEQYDDDNQSNPDQTATDADDDMLQCKKCDFLYIKEEVTASGLCIICFEDNEKQAINSDPGATSASSYHESLRNAAEMVSHASLLNYPSYELDQSSSMQSANSRSSKNYFMCSVYNPQNRLFTVNEENNSCSGSTMNDDDSYSYQIGDIDDDRVKDFNSISNALSGNDRSRPGGLTKDKLCQSGGPVNKTSPQATISKYKKKQPSPSNMNFLLAPVSNSGIFAKKSPKNYAKSPSSSQAGAKQQKQILRNKQQN